MVTCSVDKELVLGTGVACSGADTEVARCFDGATFFSVDTVVASLDIGIEVTQAGAVLTGNVYRLDAGACGDPTLFDADLTLLGTSSITLDGSETLTIQTISFCDGIFVEAGTSVVAEVTWVNGVTIFPGANSNGQTCPSYASSDSCAFPDLTDLVLIGYPDSHTVLNLNVDGEVEPCPICESDADCDDGDPCTVDSCNVDTGECSNDDIVCDPGDICVDGVCVPDVGPCGPGNGDCCTEGGNGTPGCEDEACCEAICAADTFCCDRSWDGICADSAQKSCAVCIGGGEGPPIGCDDDNDCDDGDACTDDVCGDDGLCSNPQIDCDDGDQCTDDFCVDGECQNEDNADCCEGCVGPNGEECDGDVNCDGAVDPLDSGAILARFGLDPCNEENCRYDVNCDGAIDPLDSGYVLARFDTCNEPTVCKICSDNVFNDNCEDAPVDSLSIGETLSYDGDNTDATITCAAGGFPETWHAFDLTESATVTASLCGTDPPFGDASVVIHTECPCSATFVFATDFDQLTCTDGNWAMHYYALPAGDYWTPVFMDATSTGKYTWNISAAEGPPPPAACGDPEAGDCCTQGGNGTPGCDDQECCEAICAAGDPFCCAVSWDTFCAAAAQASCEICNIPCDPPCGKGEICDNGVCVPEPEVPVNDNCEDVSVDDLSVGGCLVYNGDNTAATMTCAAGGFPEVWHAFNNVTGGANVSMGYCGTVPPFKNAYTIIDPECPCSGTFVFATSFDNGVTCTDGNWTMHYDALPAGDYWTPILQDAISTGPYTWTICAN